MKEKIWTVLIFMMGKFTRPSVRTNIIWRVRGRQAWWMWTHYFNAKRWAGCHRQVLDYTMKDLDEVLTSHKIAHYSLYSHWSHLYLISSTNTTSSFLCISLYTKGWFRPFFIHPESCLWVDRLFSIVPCPWIFFLLVFIPNYLSMVWFTTSSDINIYTLNWNKKG